MIIIWNYHKTIMSSIALKVIVLSETKESISGRLVDWLKLSIVRQVSVNDKVYDVTYTREGFTDDYTENFVIELIVRSEGEQTYTLYVYSYWHNYCQDIPPQRDESGKLPFKVDTNTIFILTGDKISADTYHGSAINDSD